jgi:hypothetical protein
MAKGKPNSPRRLLSGEKPFDRSRHMNRNTSIFLALTILMLPLLGFAQRTTVETETSSTQEVISERTLGSFRVHQFVEFGGRIDDIQGNPQMYDTYVNLHSGPRLLAQELSMQAAPGTGGPFDNLFLSSFGFGGDPEDVARLRLQKYKWYNFVGLYRRDKNVFDYNLFANPLNLNQGVNFIVPFVNATTYTGASGPKNVNFVPQAQTWFANSPHVQNESRNMGDFSLTLAPQSAVSLRLGYAINNNDGFFNTTAGQPFVTQLQNLTRWRSSRYQAGVDFKALPHTTISGDFFYEHDKTHLNYFDDNLMFRLGSPTGLPVDIGLTFFPFYATAAAGSTSCSGIGGIAIPSPGVFVLSPNCTGATLGFFKTDDFLTNIRTGQLSMQSSFRRLDIVASGTYSSATANLNGFNEFNYSLSPTLLRAPSDNKRISSNADLGFTYRLTRSWSLSDKFRYLNWREPNASTQFNFSCSHAGGATLLSPFVSGCNLGPLFGLLQGVNVGATVSGAAAGNFETITSYQTFLGERSFFNTFKVNWQPNRVFQAGIGYRYARRELRTGTGLSATGAPLNPPPNIMVQNTTTITNACIVANPTNPAACATVTLSTAPDIETEKVNQHTGLFSLVLRPVNGLRINSDVEILSADNAFTNITPIHQQRVRAYATYKLNRWSTVNGGVHIIHTQNKFAPGAVVEDPSLVNSGQPLFPASSLSNFNYGHKDHWRWYTLGATLTPNSKVSLDIGWTLLDQEIRSATCMPLPTIAFGVSSPLGTPTTLNCANSPTPSNWSTSLARGLLLDYEETTNTLFTFISFRPIKRVTLNFGYEVTGDSGNTNWTRADTGTQLQVVGDVFGNVPYIATNLVPAGGTCPGSAAPVAVTGGTACSFPGPFPDQPLGPQAINWHKGTAGITYELVKGLEFRGFWNYYDYNAKDKDPAAALLTVVAPRSFHAHIGTLSLRYSF